VTEDSLPSNRATGAFERRVALALDALVPIDQPLIVACSGGADSTATLVAVSRARRDGDGPVIAANFDHGLRPADESARDREAVQSLAGCIGRAVLFGADGGPRAVDGADGGPEAAARERRYRWLASACAEAGAAYAVTGHTLDDQAETVLLRLTRGAGLTGAAAMRPLAPWPVACEGASLQVVRPLLGLRRGEARAYLDALGLQAVEDPTNDLVSFDRNRVRHRVLPELRAVNANAEAALARFANLARDDDEALESWAEREAEQFVRIGAGAVAIDRKRLLALPRAVASRLLRQVAGRVGLNLEASQVAELLHIARRRGARFSLAGGEAVVEGDELQIRCRVGGESEKRVDPRESDA
jgi:tRNA(Ile)-lysidine synthetase-like protein